MGKSGGLTMMWWEGTNVEVQNYSCHHIDSLVHMGNQNPNCFTGFYGHAVPNQRKRSWDMLKRVESSVNETWITGGDFNAIVNEAEKEGGQRKPRALMDDFREVVEELSLVVLKADKGWFTWVNNRDGNAMAKERLDCFMISANDVANFPFIETKVVRQSKSDHDAILLDTMGRKPNECDPRLSFRYDVCWEKETDAKNII
ncbi:hypothetical protein PVK06_008828 [Gossypium arboreum]|uniref:Endonuclease/exonuclease/phosphatase domain-containing protein n=1 Tax=Gossypium arboreum TaxID=29729 RepID=A0ABR0QL44_GOSAR|nr:hypothetical protein PVK06_008828 [Gossypium arboreum]